MTEVSARPPKLETFIGYLAEIAPNSDQQITPRCHLIEDLEFDAIAFSRLGLLIYERYEIGGLSTASLQTEDLTVEGFFRNCVLDVLGVSPRDSSQSR